jgi:hypothetical protein
MSAGYAALAGAMFLGPRRVFGNGNRHSQQPANIPYVMLGTGMLWFGWFGFNSGSALGANTTAVLAFGTTIVASAAAMMSWIFFDAAARQEGLRYGCLHWRSGGSGGYHSGGRLCYRSASVVYRVYLGYRIQSGRPVPKTGRVWMIRSMYSPAMEWEA